MSILFSLNLSIYSVKSIVLFNFSWFSFISLTNFHKFPVDSLAYFIIVKIAFAILIISSFFDNKMNSLVTLSFISFEACILNNVNKVSNSFTISSLLFPFRVFKQIFKIFSSKD